MRNLPRDKCIRCEREFAAIRARRLRVIDAHIEATRDPLRIAALVKEWLREVGRV